MGKRRNLQQDWLTESAAALARAERLARELAALRGSGDAAAVRAVQERIATLREIIDRLEEELIRQRRPLHPDWIELAARGTPWCRPPADQANEGK